MSQEILTLKSGYAHEAKQEGRRYRPMTIDEARNLRVGTRVPFLAADGTRRYAKVSGSPKTWKRDPGRVEVPIKYGLRECCTLCARADGTMERLLVEVPGGGSDVQLG